MFAEEHMGPAEPSADTTTLIDLDFEIETSDMELIKPPVKEIQVVERDSPLSFIENFKLESDDEDSATKDGMSMFDVQRKLYKKECEKYGVIPVRAIAEVTSDLKSLDVSHCHFGPKGAMALATPLRLNDNIHAINMSYNDIGPDGCQAIAGMLLDNSSITEVDLSHNRIGHYGLGCICRIFKCNISVVRLNLSGNIFCDTASKYMPFLFSHPFLRELILSQNGFDIRTAKTFGEVLGSNECLEFLDISWNHFRFRSAEIIAKGIRDNVGLKKLNISYNGFGSVGLIAMGKALAHNSTLQELDIAHNRITDAGVQELCKSLSHNTTLTHLKIGGNVLTQHAPTEIIRMIQQHSEVGLVTLDIQDVFVDQVFLNLINEVKQTRELFVTLGCLEELEICKSKLMEAKQKKAVVVAPPDNIIVEEPQEPQEPQESQEPQEEKQVSQSVTEESVSRSSVGFSENVSFSGKAAENAEEVAEIPKEKKEVGVAEENLSELQTDAAGDTTKTTRFAD